ncbi:hypothetical protein IFR05_004566 [Cadophora sp. M221]|nr:hypothetical protein IFR05_004566 [Cadophora sp. M221]
MRNLPREVVAAIETAVEVNNGALESAFIHSLAKIYKTSPQAVVWNMKRYNKVKAGCDDRKPGGRPAAMDKEKAAEYIRILMTEAHCAGEWISLDKVAEIVSDHFGTVVSSTWVSRIMKKYEITHKVPKDGKLVKVTKVSQAPKPAPAQPNSTWVPQYNLPTPGQYPTFREDLQQAMGSPDSPVELAPQYTYPTPAASAEVPTPPEAPKPGS